MDVPLYFAFPLLRIRRPFESLGKAKLLPSFVLFVLFLFSHLKRYSSSCGGCRLVVQGKMLNLIDVCVCKASYVDIYFASFL